MKTVMKILSKDSISSFMEKLDFDILGISYLNEDSVKRSPRVIMNNYKILVMLQGSAGIHMGKNVYYTKQGDCVLFAPGSLYHAEIMGKERCKFLSINFSFSTAAQQKSFSDTLGLKDVAIYPEAISEISVNTFYYVMNEAIEEREGHYLSVLLLLQRLVALAIYNGQNNILKNDVKLFSDSEEKLVMQCHNYVINNPALAVTVEDLCNICNVSQSYLYKSFKSVLDMSCKEFITSTKLEMSARALMQTNKSISQIALENGFSNGYRFSNIFKKNYGLSPSAYRKLGK